MYPIGIVAEPEEAVAALRDRLVAGLADHGRVAVVERGDSPADSSGVPAGASTALRLAGAPGTATESGLTVRDALERLAPDHEYVLLAGASVAGVPTIAIGDVSVEGDALIDAPDADAVSTDAVVDALADVQPFETLESLVAAVKRSADTDRAGAIATFTGRVRERDAPDDVPTTHLEFEKYGGVANDRMAEIAADLEARDGVFEVAMYHRTGVVEAGEDIVFVVVLAGHRREAFRAVEDGIDRLKADVPIFKKEVTRDGSFWVHDRP